MEIFEQICVNSNARNVFFGIEMDKEVYKSKDVAVYDSKAFGRCLYLNDSLQLTEKHEAIYHETLVYSVMNQKNSFEKILIIGGGDGGTLREVLKFRELKNIKKIVWCEISSEVINVCNKYFPTLEIEESMNASGIELCIQDGFDFVKDNKDLFDAIIVDCSDPVGSAARLYTEDFFNNCKNVLQDFGIFAIQASDVFIQENFVRYLRYLLKHCYGFAEYIYCPIPSFPSGGIGFFICGEKSIYKLYSYDNEDLKPKYLTENNYLAAFSMTPRSFHVNRRKELFKWNCEQFFDWSKGLNTAEMRYVQKCFDLEDEPTDEENKFSLFTFSHRVKNKDINSSRMGWGTVKHADYIKEEVEDVLNSKGITLPIKGLVNGIAWDLEENHIKFYCIRSLEQLKEDFSDLYELKPEHCHESGLASLTYKDNQLFERKLYFYDLISAHMVTDKRGVVRQIHRRTDLNIYWRNRLNLVGQGIVDNYAEKGIPLDTVSYVNRDDFTLYFEGYSKNA